MASENDVDVRHSTRSNLGIPPVRYGDGVEMYHRPTHHDNEQRELSVRQDGIENGEQNTGTASTQAKQLLVTSEIGRDIRALSSVVSRDSVRKLRTMTAELEFKRRLAAMEEELERRRMERQKELAIAELELRRAEIDEEFNSEQEDQQRKSALPSEDSEMRASRIQGWVRSTDLAEREEAPQAVVNSQELRQASPATDIQSNRMLIQELVTAFQGINQRLEAGNAGSSGATRGEVRQMMARQSVGTELPRFAGQPEEWPGFIVQYRESTESCGFTDQENMCRLRKSLGGKAKDLVQSLMVKAENVQAVIQALEQKFGRPEVIVRSLIQHAKEIKSPREDNPETIIDFAIAIRNMVTTMTSLRCDRHVGNPQLLEDLAARLSPSMRMQWFMHREGNNLLDPTVFHFSRWMDSLARAAGFACPATGKTNVADSERRKPRRGEAVFQAEESSGDERKCLFCREGHHKVWTCQVFKQHSVERRREWTLENRLCFLCFRPGHRAFKCKGKQKECGKGGCRQHHHNLLHFTDPARTEAITSTATKQPEQVGVAYNSVLLRVAPVLLRGPKGSKKVFALFDEGSTTTLLDATVAKEIGVRGQKESLRLAWTNGVIQEDLDSEKIDCDICGVREKQSYRLNGVRTVEALKLRSQTIDIKKMATKWKHLSDINIQSFQDARPSLLIGQDNIDLIMPRVIREGPKNAPVATYTKLGWLVHGNARGLASSEVCDTVFHVFRTEPDELAELHRLVKESFQLDALGVKPMEHKPRCKEEERAMKIMNSTTRRVGEQWETGLLWIKEGIILPASKEMAYLRLLAIERKMDKNPVFATLYCQKVSEYLENGYCRIINEEEAAIDHPRCWYLPHFGVQNPNKPNKLRLVFDAAAKVQGVSLNDHLLTGPDLYNNLTAVLYKFRQYPVAICGDIKEMFHQVLIRKEDLPAQRFLFRGMERRNEPLVMEMSAMIFGASCSPASAQYVKNRNARENETEFPRAAEAVIKRHYMDDYLDSTWTEDEAILMIRDVSEIHRRGGFEIRNWLTNSQNVLDSIPEAVPESNVKDLDIGSETKSERVLGLFWTPKGDEFHFRTAFHKVDPAILCGKKTPTKRDVLRVVMSIFDPLGFLGHYVVRAKILNQDLWRSGIGWDDELAGQVLDTWNHWLNDLRKLKEVRIPRCYGLAMQTQSVQLHLFCDASEKAYAAVAYLRFDIDGKYHTAFVVAKTRVAPLKPSSIPRLELQAALLATRLAASVKHDHNIHIESAYFWTDSKTVLSWIRCEDPRRFLPFVAHRVGEIQESTDLLQWRWVPTKENVADDATRDGRNTEFMPDCRWFQGPEFLRESEEFWPEERVTRKNEITERDLEIKSEFLGVVSIQMDYILPDIERFSSYLRLVRVTAWCLRFIKNLRKPKEAKLTGELQVEETEEAERTWWKSVQAKSYPEEIRCLQKGREMPSTSRLLQHNPMFDQYKVLRRVGRFATRLDPDDNEKFPVFLDSKHKFTKLLLQHHHEKMGHQGQETVINELRQKYWIPTIRTAVRSTWNCCQICKNNRARPSVPEMGALPKCRITKAGRAFTIIGLDFFGPIEVKVGRRLEKRYGALFTCMNTRAVHLEIAASLTSDSAIMAIRRFVSRRGSPLEIWSDNGTNLRGADAELRQALLELDQGSIQSELSIKGIKWKFNPPSAPHMGGVWERLVRSVKTALRAILKEQHPKDEVLQTLFAEAEAIVNSRPLTHVSIDPDDAEAITPFHFILGTSSIVQAPGSFTNQDLWGRKHWKIAQALADNFWRRWVKEYLPILGRRGKWTAKTTNLKEGDIVVIADGNNERGKWPKGIIEKTYPGTDAKVRVVDVRFNGRTHRRPASKICKLDVRPLRDEEGEDNG